MRELRIALEPLAVMPIASRWNPASGAVSFSFFLPLLELALWIMLIAAPSTAAFLNQQPDPEGAGTLSVPKDTGFASSPLSNRISFAVDSSSSGAYDGVFALNLPGLSGEVLVSACTTWPQSWRPQGFQLETWRALSLAWFSLPAWWFAGKGLDGLLLQRRLGRVVLILGSVLAGLFAGMAVVYWLIISPPETPDPNDAWILWGFGLWSLLFFVFPLAWIMQLRRERAA